jgi:hypothetical protein
VFAPAIDAHATLMPTAPPTPIALWKPSHAQSPGDHYSEGPSCSTAERSLEMGGRPHAGRRPGREEPNSTGTKVTPATGELGRKTDKKRVSWRVR